MKIETKFNVGQNFYAPRVRKNYLEKKIIVDGEEYVKEYIEYEPYVKIKYIDFIVITIDNRLSQPKIEYYVNDVNTSRSGFISTKYNENIIEKYMELTAITAQALAKEYAEKGVEFFGFED